MLIDRFGGSKGIRDEAALESAINRSFAAFDQKVLYPEPVDKAGAVLDSILINHPFIDGNKKTGYVLMRMVLLQNHLDINTSQTEKYDFVIAVAKGKMTKDTIKEWLTEKLKENEKP